jgi:Xaa-Pro dipeptidase
MQNYEKIALSYNITPESEISDRISRFQKILQREEIKAAVIVQLIDRFYFSGTIQDGVLIIPAEGDSRYLCRRSVERARTESPLQIVPFKSFKEVPLSLENLGALHAARLGLELDVIPAALYQRFSSLVQGADWVDMGPLVREVRAIKSPYEIERIRAAGVQVGKVVDTAREALVEGMREVEFASILEKRARELGHQGILRMRGFNQELFYGHIFSGPDAAVISHLDAPLGGKGMNPSLAQGAGLRTIRREEPVVVDFVGNVGGYLIDQTRIMVIGDLDDEVEEGFGQARTIADAVVSAAVPGVLWSGLWEVATMTARDLGVTDRFMGPEGQQVRFVGHGIGLEVDEYPFLAPRLDLELEAGMIFALEPKIFHPGVGISGIEDTYLVTDNGLERLTVTEREIIRV